MVFSTDFEHLRNADVARWRSTFAGALVACVAAVTAHQARSVSHTAPGALNITITGGTGFIGRRLRAPLLVQESHSSLAGPPCPYRQLPGPQVQCSVLQRTGTPACSGESGLAGRCRHPDPAW